MIKDYMELEQIIKNLINDIDEVQKIWDQIQENYLDSEQVFKKTRKTRESLLWIYGATEVSERKVLEKWLIVEEPPSPTAETNASEYYDDWSDFIDENGMYTEFNSSDLPRPRETEKLNEYIHRLSKIIEENGRGTKREERARNCFLQFLRENYQQKDVAFIETIIPKKMDLKDKKIIRKILPQVYPIPIEVAGAIIKKLAHRCIDGRPNARKNAAEALALLWLCITSARVRFPRTLKSVHEIKTSALITKGEFPELDVPCTFGSYRLRIGSNVSRFLLKMAEISSKQNKDTILHTPLPDLRKHLNSVIKEVNLPSHFTDVTFLSFLTAPHYWGSEIR